MKVTKGCRFNASERLIRRDRIVNRVTSLVSVCIIVVSLLPLYFHLDATWAAVLNFAIIAFSIFILATSLLQYSNADPVRAERYHRCALEINSIRRALRATDPITAEALSKFGAAYDDVLRRYDSNHEPIDFEQYKIEHPHEYPNSDQRADREKFRRELISEFWVKSVGIGIVIITGFLIGFTAFRPLLDWIGARWLQSSG